MTDEATAGQGNGQTGEGNGRKKRTRRAPSYQVWKHDPQENVVATGNSVEACVKKMQASELTGDYAIVLVRKTIKLTRETKTIVEVV